jgi:hypothetical protein
MDIHTTQLIINNNTKFKDQLEVTTSRYMSLHLDIYVFLNSKFMKYNCLFTGLYHTTYSDEPVPLLTFIFM